MSLDGTLPLLPDDGVRDVVAEVTLVSRDAGGTVVWTSEAAFAMLHADEPRRRPHEVDEEGPRHDFPPRHWVMHVARKHMPPKGTWVTHVKAQYLASLVNQVRMLRACQEPITSNGALQMAVAGDTGVGTDLWRGEDGASAVSTDLSDACSTDSEPWVKPCLRWCSTCRRS